MKDKDKGEEDRVSKLLIDHANSLNLSAPDEKGPPTCSKATVTSIEEARKKKARRWLIKRADELDW